MRLADQDTTLTTEGQGFATPEPRLHYVTESTPQAGGTMEIAPGIHWLRMPMPMDLSHINLWLIEDGAGCTLIDTGLGVPMCTGVWEALEAGFLRTRPLQRILATHFHPDHLGCAGWLQQRHRVPMRIAARALPAARRMMNGADPRERAATVAYFIAHGMAEAGEFADRLFVPRPSVSISVMPEVDTPLQHAEIVAIGAWRFEVIETDGHAVGHQGFYSHDPRLLISGDQILPTISPNISLPASDWGQDPLGDYLASLDLLEGLPEDTLVLPSHGRPFRGLRARASDLRAHHHAHLRRLHECIATPLSAYALLPALFARRLQGMHLMMGLHECIAHLEHLVRRGEAVREGDSGSGFRYCQA
jgi:glyoxylase-like metal-dependent hydrolase (beta-lactamase superfamily II)